LYIKQVLNQKVSGGEFTKKCSDWIESRFGTAKAPLTASYTNALEMAND